MKNPYLFLAALLLCVSKYSLSYNEDDFPRKDEDPTYLDYVKAREQEYEYAMRLRDAMRREEDGFEDDEDDVDNERERFDDDRRPADDEEDFEEQERKKKRNLEKIERLKEEINNKDSPNHIKTNRRGGKSKDVKKSDYIEKKKEKFHFKKRKDKKNLDEKFKSEETLAKVTKLSDSSDKIKDSQKKSPKKIQVNIIENKEDTNKHSELSLDSVHNENVKEKGNHKEDKKLVQNSDELFKKTVKSSATTTTTAPKQPMPKAKPITAKKKTKKLDKALFIVVLAACSVAGVAGLVLAGYCWYRLRAEQDAMPDEDTKNYVKKKKKPRKAELTNDEKLAKSAEVYHYMHTKKQLAAMDKNGSERKKSNVEESDSSDEESDNTVYECPGLAPPGDMKVVNPLFSDAEKEHSDARSDGSHVSSPTRDKSPPQKVAEKH